MAECSESDLRDLVRDRRASLLLWRVPLIALIASAFLKDSLKAAIWTGSLTQMGVACLLNASRCGRLHCFFTGPFFLLGALASLLRGTGMIRLTWSRIGITMLVGGILLTWS